MRIEVTGLTLDQEEHRYYLQGRELMSVGSVLKSVNLLDSRWYTPSGSTRGRYIHEMLELDDRAELDEATLDPQLLPALWAYRKFKATEQPHYVAIETPIAWLDGDVAGTPDRIEWDGRTFTITDIKSGAKSVWHRWQTAGYAIALSALTETLGGKFAVPPREIRRRIVRLTKAGNYRIDYYTDNEDIRVFRAAAICARARRDHKIYTPESDVTIAAFESKAN
jgi:hypothetical protein